MSQTLLVGTRKGLLVYEPENNGYRRTREAFVGAQTTMAMADPRTGWWWACLNHGHWGVKLHRSRNAGRDWEEVAAPAMPEGAELEPGKPASVSYLWSMEPAEGASGNRLYLGTIPGGLFTSDDDGASWQLCQNLWDHPTRSGWFGGGFDQPGIHSILLDPADPQRVAIGISCAGVFETRDGGRSWATRNKGLSATFLPDPNVEVGHDPHRVVASAADRRVMWQQNHCGIFRTADGGETWQACSSPDGVPHFGFAIECDATDPLTAWVVPATSDEQRVAIDRALVVCRTSDGGQTWQQFRQGLPQQDCYDFAFRHGLAASGAHLALGTSSGSLYLSDDRGETWQAVAKDLSAVYSVRWA
jgi:photosystem II stability/assembly factor-like uncharacterized protein